jgi:hypothetical protein
MSNERNADWLEALAAAFERPYCAFASKRVILKDVIDGEAVRAVTIEQVLPDSTSVASPAEPVT